MALWAGLSALASESLRPHVLGTGTRDRKKYRQRSVLTFFLMEGASQGHSALGSYCLRSLSLLKVFQECGGLTHASLSSQSEVHKTAFPFSHSYSNIGPHASQMELAEGIWGCESR
jgi:hypothetical protein